ncbi:MAG: DEAD/DEAH box helicase family protein [Synergistaceae bacterium]|jgi:superfamily II DNA or RNA helicase|nr:DEAD/DEAH box helicase family protein [Synergistaceae bacterium]
MANLETEMIFRPGDRIVHFEFGEGVVLSPAREGYLRVFFSAGERQVPTETVHRQLSRVERILHGTAGDEGRARKAWLSFEANALPVMENATSLTSAKIDLLPHQVVLTHRVATVSPRRFLIADEVGLGKTIEIALILRELDSRDEMERALIIVPAGLVNNWHHELNEVFNLNFEIFGSEGDITDRKTNAFAKHNRIIASIDTLKRPARIRRIQDAPRWDLVVFDEAHHLTAAKTGAKVNKTANYKLAEALKDHSRDLLLLSATPHQGNHFQFWMIAQLLNPTLFRDVSDMLENRHRLNAVMFRRTKADACRPDGSSLFARRVVNTEAFLMNDEEKRFYEKLRGYLEDGFNLAHRQGNKGRILGFLMAIFQKIAASSFAAVQRTLKRRLLMLTLYEALLRDRALDIEGREKLTDEARSMIREHWGFSNDSLGQSETDRVLADLKYRILKKLDDGALETISNPNGGEFAAAGGENIVSDAVTYHLPEERLRINELLAFFPSKRETKAQKLIDGLGVLWNWNFDEKIVIFATYLGTVDLIAREIEAAYPGQGVVVLRGGDHGAKTAAERKFKSAQGPRVLVCTAAGREGINLQFAHVLFNFDLPWNPMDVEQRIGRIHRYGQSYAAQVYNLVLSNTIEGRIFLLLEEKLNEIAKTVGKMDEKGNIAEDMRSQILGQLSERLNYDRLYQDALSDPELKRTRQELEVALSNSNEAREVVFDLFQDLEGFSLDDYKPFSDVSSSMERLVNFFSCALAERGQKLLKTTEGVYELSYPDHLDKISFTLDRDEATSREGLELMGLDHPLVQKELNEWRDFLPEGIGISVAGDVDELVLLSIWTVEISSGNCERRSMILPIAVKRDGVRAPSAEHQFENFYNALPAPSQLTTVSRNEIFSDVIEPALQRELRHRSAGNEEGGYSAKLIGYIEIVPIKDDHQVSE